MKDYNEMAESVFERRDKYNAERKMAMNKFKKGMTGAVCCCLAALLGVGVFNSNSIPSINDLSTNTPHAESMKAPQQTGEEKQGTTHENEVQTTNPPPVVDAPVTEDPGNTGALVAYDEIWGGSYMNEEGRWVIWLTENTTENQQEVFKRNPELNRETTIFKTADYPYAYLTALMADISKAMGNNELPFVPTAALRDDLNRVEVRMTADDAESIAQVLAFDTVGGAIEIRYLSGYATTEELVKTPAK